MPFSENENENTFVFCHLNPRQSYTNLSKTLLSCFVMPSQISELRVIQTFAEEQPQSPKVRESFWQQ